MTMPWLVSTVYFLLPFASLAKKPSFFLQIVLAYLFKQILFPPFAPSLPPLLHQSPSLNWFPSPFFSLHSGLIVLVLPYWNQATCTRLCGCHKRDIKSWGRWFCGAQADSSTIPDRMTELWCRAGRFVSVSPAAWFVKVRALGFSLSNFSDPRASIHKLRLSHVGSLARVKQQTLPPYQATPILTPAPNMGKQELLKEEVSVIWQHDQTIFGRLLLKKA